MTDVKSVLRDAGIVGAGGAGFPSYAKLAEGADTLIVNGSECEPLLHTDYEIIKQHISEVVAGAEMIAASLGIGRVIFAVKEHTSHGLGLHGGQFGVVKRCFVEGGSAFVLLACDESGVQFSVAVIVQQVVLSIDVVAVIGACECILLSHRAGDEQVAYGVGIRGHL